jgi:predicted MPP superfamily phosphohydrolase
MSMQIRYISDLHTEFYDLLSLSSKLLFRIKGNKEQICVCAGDIGNLHTPRAKKNYDITMDYLSKNFKKVFVIPGNHEYYGGPSVGPSVERTEGSTAREQSSIEATDTLMRSYFDSKAFSNVTWLNNTTEEYEGVTFIGTTLWTHVPEGVPEINDTKLIPELTREGYNAKHETCKAWLRSLVPLQQKSVIITHHLPLEQLVAPKYRGAAINPWFYCNMNKFIDNNKTNIACWIYGHTHTASLQTINGVQFACNPAGYPGENAGILRELVVPL